MSALESGVLQMLGLGPRSWRAWREVSLFSGMMMELSWTAPWLHAMLVGPRIASPQIIFAALAALSILTYLMMRMVTVFGVSTAFRQAILVVLLLLFIPRGLVIILQMPESMGIFSSFSLLFRSINNSPSLLPAEFLIFLGFIWVWMRSIRWATSEGLSAEVLNRFRFGFVVFFVYLIVFTWPGGPGPGPFIYTYVFFGLLALGGSRLARAEAQASNVDRFFTLNWLGSVLLAIGGFALLLGLVGALITGNFGAVQQGVLYLWLLFWGLVLLVFSPIVILVTAIFQWIMERVGEDAALALQPVTQFFQTATEGVAEFVESLADSIDAGWLQGLIDWINSLPLANLIRILRPMVFWGTLVLILVLGVIYAGRRIGLWRALRGVTRTEKSSVENEDWRRSLLDRWRDRLSGLRDGLGRLLDPNTGRRILAAARIRRVYTFLLDLSANLGTARHEAQTPSEYLPVLQAIFPEHHPEVETISQAYQRVRYGELDETPNDVIEVDRAWLRLRLEGERQKRERRKERMKPKANLRDEDKMDSGNASQN